MFDELMDALTFGRKMVFRGKEYVVLKMLQNGYVLVVKNNSTLPSQALVIKDPEYDKTMEKLKKQKEEKEAIEKREKEQNA